MINDAVKQNFDTLLHAVMNGRICLMECKRKKDGEIVNLVCVINYDDDGSVITIPVAEMMTGDPFEDYFPPNPDGGFFEDDLNA